MRDRLNFRPAAVLLAAVVLTAAGVALAHRWQARRHVAGLQDLARAALSKGRPDRAAWLFGMYLDRVPDDAAARAEYGRVMEELALDARGRRAAADIYEQVLAGDPGLTDVRTRLARLCVRDGRLPEALAHLSALQADTAADAGLAFLMGECQEARGDAAAAVKCYRRAIDLDPAQVGRSLRPPLLPRKPPAAGGKAAAAAAGVAEPPGGDAPRAKVEKEADALVDRAVEANPGDATARLARAQYRLEYQPAADPGPDLSAAVALAPTDLATRLTAARAAKDPEVARGHLRVALEHHPGDERVYTELAGVEVRAGNRAEAAAVLRRGAARLPGRPRLLFGLADLLIGAGNLPEAERAVAEISRWKLSPERVVLLRGRLRMAAGNWQAARETLEAGRAGLTTAGAGPAADADMLLGHCHEQLGELDLALAAYRRAAAERPRSDAAASAARVLVGSGRLDEAVEQYRLLGAEPDAPAADRLMYARLRTLQYLASPPGTRSPEEVEPAFARAAEKLPAATELLLLRAEVLAADKKLAAAETLLRDALARAPAAAEVGLPLARLLHRDGRPADAWGVIDALDQKGGPAADSALTRLELIPSGGDPRAVPAARAAEHLFSRAALPDDRQRLAAGLAEAQARWGNLPEARRWALEVARLRPADLSARFLLFDLAVQADDRPQMEETVRGIHQVEGGQGAFGHYADSLLRLARPKDHTKEGFAEARQHLAAAALLRPAWANVPTSRALLAEYEGKPDEALTEYVRAIDLGERRPAVVRRAVQLLCARRRYPEADRLIRRLGPQEYVSAQFHKLAAEVSLFSRETQRAVELAVAAVAPDSKAYDEHLWQAEILAAAGKNAEAVAAFRRAIDVAGPHGAPWVGLVRHYVRTAERDKAEAAVAEAGKRLPGPELPLTLAQCYEAVGRADRAAAAYQEAVDGHPEDAEALRQLTGFYDRAGTPSKAAPVLGRALGRPLPPADAAWVRRALAVALASAGDYPAFQEALRLVDQDAAAAPGGADALLTKARVLAARPSHRREAAQILRQARQKQRLGPADEFLLAQLSADTGAWPEGRRLLVDLLSREGDNPASVRFLVDRLLRNGQTGEAEVWLGRLERVAPDDRGTARLRALFLIKRGEYREAAAVVSQAARPGKTASPAGPTLPDADRDRLRAVARLADDLSWQSADASAALTPVAESLFREAAKGGTPADELALAWFLGRRGRVEEAIALARAAEGKADTVAVAGTLLAVAFAPTPLSDARLDAVEAEVKACLGRAKPAPGAAVIAGTMHARRGRYAEAAAAYRSVVEADGKNAGMMNNLAYMLILTNGRTGEVQALLEKAMTLTGPTAGLLDTRGVAHLAEGRTAEAVADLERAVDQEPTAARCLHLAAAYQRAGRQKDAADTLAKAAATQTDGSLALPAEHTGFVHLNKLLKPA